MAVAGPLTVLAAGSSASRSGRARLHRLLTWSALTASTWRPWPAPARAASFWAGVDLAIALPISWVPLVADYARFGRSAGSAFWAPPSATSWPRSVLRPGVLFLLSIGQGDVIAALLAVPVGLLALAVLVVDETDEASANLYSAGVSLKNAAPRLPGAGSPSPSAPSPPWRRCWSTTWPATRFLFLLGALFVPVRGAGGRLVRARPPPLDVEATDRADGPYRGVAGRRWRPGRWGSWSTTGSTRGR